MALAPLAIYPVTFPDGYEAEVEMPEGVEPSVVFAKALQDRSVKEGRIQTTWLGGASKQMGQEKAANTALMTGVGLATGGVGGVALTALSPLASTWIDYATKANTGENPEKPSAMQQGVDLAGGAASLIPVGKVAEFAAGTMAPGLVKPLMKVSGMAKMGEALTEIMKRRAAPVTAAPVAEEAAEKAGSYLFRLSGQAMVDASPAQKMILQKQRLALNEIAKSDAAKDAAEKAAKAVMDKAKKETPSAWIQAAQAGISAAYRVLGTSATAAINRESQ